MSGVILRDANDSVEANGKIEGMNADFTDPNPLPPVLDDILAPHLDLIIVGAAASLHSARAHHWYAGPRNRFYALLHQSGFTPRQLEPEEDSLLPQFGIGLTCIHKYAASSANHLLPVPTSQQREILRQKLLFYAPRIICFNGKDVFQMVTGQVCTDWGEQEERIGEAVVYVVQSSSGRADLWGRERLEWYHELHERVASMKGTETDEAGNRTFCAEQPVITKQRRNHTG